VAGDEVYGADPTLRETLEDRGIGYVLAVACNHQIRTDAHARTGKRAGKIRADELAASLPRMAWQRLSAGDGSKGPRYYDWAWISIQPERDEIDGQRRQWWLLIRRNNTTGELAYYRCWAPTPVPLHHLVRVAGRRWTIEESFQASPRRPRPAPGAALDQLATLDSPRDARLRLPGRRRRDREGREPSPNKNIR
jgi:SRSO17 transposase